ncbi:MAG: InlB B-repeat-containing protein [Clostridia bacterium]|nr:InlB B-repeat-containing protein [Clostridia bacterium]
MKIKTLSILITLLCTVLLFSIISVSAAEGDSGNLVITGYTDFELYDHAVLTALIDGTETSINVNKIYDGTSLWADVTALGDTELQSKLSDVFGAYTYTVDANGYYMLTKFTPSLMLSGFVSTVGENTDNILQFEDWEAKYSTLLDQNNDGNVRTDMLRVNSSSKVYLIDGTNKKVLSIPTSSYFNIQLNTTSDAAIMTDRIGYGDNDSIRNTDGNVSVKYGVCTYMYIFSDGSLVEEPVFTITYDANGGTGAPAPQTHYQDALNNKITGIIPTLEGYTFCGWSTTPDGSVEYASNADYTNTDDITLYAVWTPEDEHIIIKKHVSYVVSDHAVLEAIIGTTATNITVKTIYEPTADGSAVVWADITKLSESELIAKLSDILGVYTYEIDGDGFYVLTKHPAVLDLSDYVSTVGINSDDIISFSDWQVSISDIPSRSDSDVLHINSSTSIYLINKTDGSVEKYTPQENMTITIDYNHKVKFITDRLGYGDYDALHHSAGTDDVKYGVSTYLYLITEKSTDETAILNSLKYVFIDDEIESTGVGDAPSFELESGEPDIRYYSYDIENDEAYRISNFAALNTIYISNELRDTLPSQKLVPGIYLLNDENIVVGYTLLDDIKDGKNTITYNGVDMPYYVWTIKPESISMYDYKYKTILDQDYTFTSANNVQTIKFKFYELEAGQDTVKIDKSNDKLVEYLYDNFSDGARVLILPNTSTSFDSEAVFLNNTLYGIALDPVVIPALGDLDSDGYITATDSTVIARSLASWSGYGTDTFNSEMADVDNDGSLTASDGVILSRHLAKWSGYETLPYTG